MIYLDTTVFVFAVASGGKAQQLLQEIAIGNVKASTSVITWDETIWALKHTMKDYAFAKTEGNRLLLLPNMIFFDLSFEIVKKAQELIDKYPTIRPRDALHAATAITQGIDTIVSDDSDFDMIKELKRIALAKMH